MRIRPGLAVERRKGPDRPAVPGATLLQRRGAQHLQGAGHRIAEGLRGEARPPARAFEQPAAPLDLRLEVVLALAGGFELLGRDALLLPVEVRRFDLAREALRVPVADAAAKTAFDVVVDHLGEAAELALDGVGLPDQDLQDVVLGALRQDEVVAAHPRRRLQLAVDAPVALLDAARVPGQVEVEEVGAVGLEVQPLAGGVGGDEDAQRVARGVGVEAALDLLALRPHGLPVDGLDTLLGEVGAGDGLFEHLAQVALGADDVLREDQHPGVVPARGGRWRGRGRLASPLRGIAGALRRGGARQGTGCFLASGEGAAARGAGGLRPYLPAAILPASRGGVAGGGAAAVTGAPAATR